MATWYNHAATFADPETGAFSEDIKALASNPVAIAEGAVGAPKVVGKAVNIDAGNLAGTGAIIDLDDAAKVLLVAVAVHTVATGNVPHPTIGYQLSANNGGTWGAAVVLADVDAGYTAGGSDATATAVGTSIIDMTGSNAIRLSGTGTLSGSLIWVEGA